jgi:hypothetical protein
MKTLNDYLTIIQNVPKGITWDSLTGEQKEAYNNKTTGKLLLITLSKDCFMCSKKFEKPLFLPTGWNSENLFHYKETHGLEPEILIDLVRDVIGLEK